MTEVSIGALAAKQVSRWAWWQRALASPAEIGKRPDLLMSDGDAQQGYYRVRYGKDKPYEPVAIFYPEGSDELVAYRDGREVRSELIGELWNSCRTNPVSYDAYNRAVAGGGWDDEDTVVANQIKPPAPDPEMGDNSGKVDEAETLKDQIDAALQGLSKYQKIEDDQTAAKALSLRNRLNELSGQAEKIRVKLKEPHLEAGKAVDAKWNPLVKQAKAGADQVKSVIGAWETEKLRRHREAERLAAEARAKEEAERRAAEQAEQGDLLTAPKVETAPPVAAPAEPVQIKPTYGKAASVSAKVVVDQITDWQALAVYMSSHQECQDLLRKLAQRALDAGRRDIPGVTTTEEARIR